MSSLSKNYSSAHAIVVFIIMISTNVVSKRPSDPFSIIEILTGKVFKRRPVRRTGNSGNSSVVTCDTKGNATQHG